MKVVIVGSGVAGIGVAESLAQNAGFDVTVVTSETHGYYSRPRLSHGIAIGDEAAAKIVLKPFGAMSGIRVLAGAEAWRIDRERQRLFMETGDALDYDVLILATGSAARIPAALAPSRPHFLTLNSLDDLLTLRRRFAKSKAHRAAPPWAVVGGGLIGCEVASDLRKAGASVTIFHREDRLLELQLSSGQSQALHEHFGAQGIEVRFNQNLGELPRPYDGVIVATGFVPRIELAKESGLATGRGIVVNDYLRTDDPGVYAVGDVAEVGGKLYPFVLPIRSQASWLSGHLGGRAEGPWIPPVFTPVMKIHGFKVEPEASRP